MSGEYNQASNPAPLKRNALWKVYKNSGATDAHSPSREFVRCAACGQTLDASQNRENCSSCGASLIPESEYAKHEPSLVPLSHEVYYLTPPRRTIDERRHPRIACKNVQACVRTEHGIEVIVDLINISRGGVCFSSFHNFNLHATVLISTHYFDGGQKIFTEGRIVRVQRKPTNSIPGEFAIQFAPGTLL